MLGVDHGRDAAGFLGFGGDVQCERCLAARLGTEDLDDPATRQSATTQGKVERQATGRYAFDRQQLVAGQRHNRAFAELLFDRSYGVSQLRAGFQDSDRLFR